MDRHGQSGDDALLKRIRRLPLQSPDELRLAAIRRRVLAAAPPRFDRWPGLAAWLRQPVLFPAAALLILAAAIWLSRSLQGDAPAIPGGEPETILNTDLQAVVEPLPYIAGDYRQVEDFFTPEEALELAGPEAPTPASEGPPTSWQDDDNLKIRSET